MNSADLARYIEKNQIAAQIVHLTEPTPTVELAATAVGVQPEQIGKSILFLAQGSPLLVIASGTGRIDYKLVAAHLGISRKHLKMASASHVLDITGYQVGTVPPFGHKTTLTTMVESRVMAKSVIYVGGGELNALLRITPGELLRATGGEVIAFQED